MSHSSPFDEHTGANDGAIDFPSIGDGHFVFEDKNLVYNDEDHVQHELEIQLAEESQTDVSATVLWKHVVKGKKCGSAHGGSHIFKCKHCQKVYHGTYTRVYAHLMGHKKGESKGIGYCSAVKADKNLQMQIKREVEQVESSPNIVPLKKSKLTLSSGMGSQGPSLALSYVGPYEKDYSMQNREEVDSKVMRCLCANGIPFSVLKSPYWEEMVLAISRELGYKCPTLERAQTILLENERNRVEREFDDFRQKWPQYGISILSNGWADIKTQPLINVVASNQFGSMFLHAFDFLAVEKSQKSISDYLMDAIEKVGPSNVVQLVTENAIECKEASEEEGKFSTATAKRDARNPKINVLQWWKFHGGNTKELRDVAFKVLAQPISSSSLERPWSTYTYIHNAKRNRLNSSCADDLLFIHTNLRLLSRCNSNYKHGPYRKWDVNPEIPLMDECALQLEDLCFLGLDDEDSLKQSSLTYNPLQELIRIIEGVPSENNQSGDQSHATSSIRPSGGKEEEFEVVVLLVELIPRERRKSSCSVKMLENPSKLLQGTPSLKIVQNLSE
uniref:HAT C-terminal dimerisation domain-containing protein n=1 Tax=Ananas comosus var. bracteatus TaxID=296719 RepID=A0A6V7PG37_ANACO|nr:unnamed protein product [Ananas comosus var. bracteatus]